MNTNESPLTQRQREVLGFVREWRSRKGKMPSTREIQRHFGFASQTAAVNHLKALERKGFLRRMPGDLLPVNESVLARYRCWCHPGGVASLRGGAFRWWSRYRSGIDWRIRLEPNLCFNCAGRLYDGSAYPGGGCRCLGISGAA